jgi:hypothetical protein
VSLETISVRQAPHSMRSCRCARSSLGGSTSPPA